MCGKTSMINMGFTHDRYPAGTHMCLVYCNELERQQTISKFVEGGLSAGERVSYFSDEVDPPQVKKWLADLGVDLPVETSEDLLAISTAADSYYPLGHFDPDSMIDSLKTFFDQAMAAQCPACRGTGEMSWALKNVPGSDRLMEYESRLNDLLIQYPITALCQYDARKFDGATILDCLKVHPYMIVHGQVLKNPYYMKTDVFLNELAARKQ
jgi:hypothetical protein